MIFASICLYQNKADVFPWAASKSFIAEKAICWLELYLDVYREEKVFIKARMGFEAESEALFWKIYNWKSNSSKIWSEDRLWRRRPEKLHSQAENILYDPVLVHFKNLDVFSSFLAWFIETGKVTTIKIVLQKFLTSASCSTRRGNNYKVFTFFACSSFSRLI